MRFGTRLLTWGLVALALAASAASAQDGSRPEYPLAKSSLVLKDGGNPSKRRIVFQARWEGQATFEDPTFAGASLRVAGTGATDGDTGVIQLAISKWRGLGRPAGSKGYRYEDKTQASGGVRRIIVKQGKKGGVVRVVGGGPEWRYTIGGPQSGVTLGFTLGEARWCAEFVAPLTRNAAGQVKARSETAPASCPCDNFGSTFEAIQELIFEKRGCTQAACHGAALSGGLDLRRDASYDHLVDVPAVSAPLARVEPGEQARSVLWQRLAAGTRGLQGVGAPMPSGGLPPLPESELEAIRSWIRVGAPRTGVVIETEGLLDSCLPPPDPIKIRPPDAPAASEGIQLYAPPWDIPAGGENEVCYATYYDLSTRIPDSAKAPCPDFWGGPTKTCFFYNRSELTQDPNSHHSIIHLYKGAYEIDSLLYTCQQGSRNRQACDPADAASCPGGTCVGTPTFGPFTCKGGANAGVACNPKGIGVPAPDGAECGADSGCTGRIQQSVACVFYGPPDWGFDVTGSGTNNAPQIGGSQQPVSQNNYPAEVYAMLPVSGTLVWNSHAFNLTEQPTTNEQWLNIWFAGQSDRVYPVRGIFDSKDIFVQNVLPFEKQEYCRTYTLPQGARLFNLSSHTHKRGSLFRVWGPGITDRCGSENTRPIKPAACLPEAGPPVLTTTVYNDPAQVEFDPPLVLDSADESSRTLKFCAVYDNGFTRPEEVKLASTSPPPPMFLAPGGPCAEDKRACVDGPRKGQLCNGDERSCDSTPGANDGRCDACPLRGGVTTEDEMFILLGGYYVVP